MLQLKDDILLHIFFIACRVPRALVKLALVCKRFQYLSQDRSLWLSFYTSNGLERAFGPPTWHSTSLLKKRVLRYHHVTRNLEVGSRLPQITPSHTPHRFELDNDRTSLFVFGRFVFFVRKDATIVCLDMARESPVIWEHPQSVEAMAVAVRSCDITHTDTPGVSLMSLLVQISEHIMLIYLNIFHETEVADVVRLVEIDTKVVDINYDFLFCWKRDWFVHVSTSVETVGVLCALDVRTSRRYQTNKSKDLSPGTCSFAGPSHIVVLFQFNDDTWGANGGVIAVFTLPPPNSDLVPHPDQDPGRLDCVYRYDTSKNILFYEELHPSPAWKSSWTTITEFGSEYPHVQTGTWTRTRTSFLAAAQYKNPSDKLMVIVQLSFVETLEDGTNDGRCQLEVTMKIVENPSHVYRDYKCFSQYHGWVLTPHREFASQCYSNGTYSFTRILYSRAPELEDGEEEEEEEEEGEAEEEEGEREEEEEEKEEEEDSEKDGDEEEVTFADPVLVRFPSRFGYYTSAPDQVSFDECNGKCFLLFSPNRGTVCDVVVLDFA